MQANGAQPSSAILVGYSGQLSLEGALKRAEVAELD